MKAYCINLNFRSDKWEKFTIQKYPFYVERFEAIKRNSGREGCALSHLEVMAKCEDEILIFEYDCKILQDLEIFYKAYYQLPSDWDILHLGGNVKNPLQRYSENLFILKTTWAAHGILYRRNVIDKILHDGMEMIKQYNTNIDTYLNNCIYPYYKCYLIYPFFATQFPGHSDTVNSFRHCSDFEENYIKHTINYHQIGIYCI